jgi:hypothetical protein
MKNKGTAARWGELGEGKVTLKGILKRQLMILRLCV